MIALSHSNKEKKKTHIGHVYTLFILHSGTVRDLSSVEHNSLTPPLMLVTNLATFCCGMASHSSTSICFKSANVVLLVTLA